MMKKRNSFSFFIKALAIILPMIMALSALSGCFNTGPKSEEEIQKKQYSMMLSLDDFSFDGMTCSAQSPKMVIQISNPEETYYILPTKDKIKIPTGMELHMYLGEPYLQPLRPGETIDVPKDSIRTITMMLSSEGQDLVVRLLVANLGDNPIPLYVGFPNIEGVSYFDENGYEIDIFKDIYPSVGSDFKFMVGLDEEYSQSNIVVRVNGSMLLPDGDGVYTVYEVSEDLIITIEGVTLNPTTTPEE